MEITRNSTEIEEQEAPPLAIPISQKKRWISWISVEPVVFLFAFYGSGTIPLTQQYIYNRVAVEFNSSIQELNNVTTCTTNRSDPEYILHHDVLHITSSWVAYLSAAQLPFAFLMTLLLGSYSDNGGRKPGIIVPLIGGLLKTSICTMAAVFNLRKEVLFAAVIAEGLCGSYACFFMGVFSFISDITNHENRSLRIVIVETAMGLGIVAGSYSMGFCIPAIGFTYSFVIMAATLVIAIVLSFILPESRVIIEKPKLFTTEHVKTLMKVLSKTDEHGRRWRLMLCVVILIFVAMVEQGRDDASTLFVLNSPICWNATQIGYFSAFAYMLSTAGSLGSTKLFQHNLMEMGLIILGAVSGIGQLIFQALSTTTLMFYMATVIGVCIRLPGQMLRSYASKLVTVDEQGAIYVAFAMIQVTAALCGSIFFTTVYNVTMDIMAGLVFFVGAGFYVMAGLFAGVLLCMRKKSRYSMLKEEHCA